MIVIFVMIKQTQVVVRTCSDNSVEQPRGDKARNVFKDFDVVEPFFGIFLEIRN